MFHKAIKNCILFQGSVINLLSNSKVQYSTQFTKWALFSNPLCVYVHFTRPSWTAEVKLTWEDSGIHSICPGSRKLELRIMSHLR